MIFYRERLPMFDMLANCFKFIMEAINGKATKRGR